MTEIKYKNPPLEPGVTKPQLGTSRLFLWFDSPGCPVGPLTSAHPLGCRQGFPSWHREHHAPLPLQAGHHRGMGFSGGGDRGMLRGKSMGKALRASCPVAGVRGHGVVRCELGEGDMFW